MLVIIWMMILIVMDNHDICGKKLFHILRAQAEHYRSNHIMLTMGMDFNYQAAHAWFLNLDRFLDFHSPVPVWCDDFLNIVPSKS